MIQQYNAVGLQTQMYQDVEKNLDNLEVAIDTAYELASQELPVKLLCLAESAIQGMPTEASSATTIPGPETDRLAEKAREHDLYLIGDLLFVQLPDMPDDCLFNCLFVIDPDGEVIYTRPKCQIERIEAPWSTVPHDLWDEWVDSRGDDLDAFFPVAETEIGNIGCAVCMERSYPEVARGLAMNGAEIIYLPTYHQPFVGNDMYEVQARSRAMDNTCYVISPNSGAYMLPGRDAPFDICGGESLICDYKGQVIGRHDTTDNAFVAATLNVEALREYRNRNLGIGNFLKDLRTEQFQAIYEDPIYPKNLRSGGDLPSGDELYETENQILRENIQRLQDRGVYEPPAHSDS